MKKPLVILVAAFVSFGAEAQSQFQEASACMDPVLIWAYSTSGASTRTSYLVLVKSSTLSPPNCAASGYVMYAQAANSTTKTNVNNALASAGVTSTDVSSNLDPVVSVLNTTTVPSLSATLTTVKSGQASDASNITALQSAVLALQNAAGLGTAFDPVQAGLIWAFFFTTVFSLWFVSKNIGVVVNAVRRF